MPPRKKSAAPANSIEDAHAYLERRNRDPVQLEQLVAVVTRFVQLPRRAATLIEWMTWMRAARRGLRRIEPPPPTLRALADSGVFVAATASLVDDRVPSSPARPPRRGAARLFVTAVTLARNLIADIAELERVIATPGFHKQLKTLSRMSGPDILVAAATGVAKANGWSRMLASELAALAVVARLDEPTDDWVRRQNTWARRLQRARALSPQDRPQLHRLFAQVPLLEVLKLDDHEMVSVMTTFAAKRIQERGGRESRSSLTIREKSPQQFTRSTTKEKTMSNGNGTKGGSSGQSSTGQGGTKGTGGQAGQGGNWPSTTGNPSGGGRGNAAPSK